MPSHDDLDEQLANFERAENRRLLSEHMSKWQAKVANKSTISSSVFRDEMWSLLMASGFLILLGFFGVLISLLENAPVVIPIVSASVIAVTAIVNLVAYVSCMFWRDRLDELKRD